MEMIAFSPVHPEFKTSGIEKSEWFDLFTPVEQIKLSELKNRLEDYTFKTTQLDAEFIVDGFTTTYRAVMRAYFAAWDSAPYISVRHPMLYPSLELLEYLGILDDETRKDTLIQGIPL